MDRPEQAKGRPADKRTVSVDVGCATVGTMGGPCQALPSKVTFYSGEAAARVVHLHHLERRPPAAACPRVSGRTARREVDLDNKKVMKGAATSQSLALIAALESEGLL